MNNRIAVIDDHEIYRLGIQQFVSTMPNVIFAGAFADVQEFLQHSSDEGIDVLLLDETLPFVDVRQAVQQITVICPQLAVIVFGSNLNAGSIRELSQLGVLGFICKTDNLRDALSSAIRSVLHRQLYLSPEALLISHDPDPAEGISPRLREVLELIESGLYVQDMAKTLGITPRAVYSARKRLKEFFNAHTDAEMIAKAIRRGYLFKD